MRKRNWDRAFYKCPGAWCGNEPTNGMSGNITIDVIFVVQAVIFLKKYFEILETKQSTYKGGVLFVLQWKEAK